MEEDHKDVSASQPASLPAQLPLSPEQNAVGKQLTNAGSRRSDLVDFREVLHPDFKLSAGTNGRPPCSIAVLLAYAINKSPCRCLAVSELYSWISTNFSHYDVNRSGWKNTVRHTLSIHPLFVRTSSRPVQRSKSRAWTIDYASLYGGKLPSLSNYKSGDMPFEMPRHELLPLTVTNQENGVQLTRKRGRKQHSPADSNKYEESTIAGTTPSTRLISQHSISHHHNINGDDDTAAISAQKKSRRQSALLQPYPQFLQQAQHQHQPVPVPPKTSLFSGGTMLNAFPSTASPQPLAYSQNAHLPSSTALSAATSPSTTSPNLRAVDTYLPTMAAATAVSHGIPHHYQQQQQIFAVPYPLHAGMAGPASSTSPLGPEYAAALQFFATSLENSNNSNNKNNSNNTNTNGGKPNDVISGEKPNLTGNPNLLHQFLQHQPHQQLLPIPGDALQLQIPLFGSMHKTASPNSAVLANEFLNLPAFHPYNAGAESHNNNNNDINANGQTKNNNMPPFVIGYGAPLLSKP